MKIYLAGSLFSEGEVHQRKREYKICKEALPEATIFSPIMADFNENKDTKLPTPTEIFSGDTVEIDNSNYVIFDLGNQLDPGVNAELGLIAGINMNREKSDWIIPIGVLSDIRLASSSQYEIPPFSMNHYVLGIFDVYGEIASSFVEAVNLIGSMEDTKHNGVRI